MSKAPLSRSRDASDGVPNRSSAADVSAGNAHEPGADPPVPGEGPGHADHAAARSRRCRRGIIPCTPNRSTHA